jgi:hypothetical protein
MGDSGETGERFQDEDSVFGDINLLSRSLHKLDERGLVLSLAAFAEDALGSLLKAYMLPTEASNQLLEGFNAPLGTLSARIKAARSFGLITKDQFDDLEHLRKIRNEFAHSWRTVTFLHPKVSSHVAGLNYSSFDDRFPETPIEKVRTSVSSLLVELRSATNQIEKKGARVQKTGARLIAGFPGDVDQQIEAARKQLFEIEECLKSAVGEKHTFFRFLLKRFWDRLATIEEAAPAERRADVAALRNDVKRKLLE